VTLGALRGEEGLPNLGGRMGQRERSEPPLFHLSHPITWRWWKCHHNGVAERVGRGGRLKCLNCAGTVNAAKRYTVLSYVGSVRGLLRTLSLTAQLRALIPFGIQSRAWMPMSQNDWRSEREHVYGFVGDHMLVVSLRRGPKVAQLSVGCVDCGADIWTGVVNYDVSGDDVIRMSLEEVNRHLDECEAPVPLVELVLEQLYKSDE
jgi:hypothetical protein